ncbi:uncharacterized protein BKA55DRAFT_562506 [Fusarium redolens]|uniref:Uncharacterized protein n=1 Tax=Fusarium redolens TaxID=48865 RepID=A0A9P9HL87_FUSRE|nr:uncharacterized protein BKA55DRAFT_562506 [Fusarium redolens]KAH7259411.1 hypothetical protein BKA55DRAFT_562506 [Fusarium redolens]
MAFQQHIGTNILSILILYHQIVHLRLPFLIMNKLITALSLVSAALALPLTTYDECENAFYACVAAGTPEMACSCTLTACVGEDSARLREYCSSATASLAQPTKTDAPSVSSNDTAPVETFTPIPGIPGGCNPAHPGSCPPPYHTGLPPTFTPIPIVPGGCSPAHPELCASSHVTYTATSIATHPSIPVPTDGTQPAPYPSPKPVDGKTWAIQNLTRYCGEDDDGCDYNFAVEADGKTERCTIIRMPGSNAVTESWANEPCTDGSDLSISWGYVTEPAPAFAVLTVVKDKQLAWFGVSDVNGQQVTPSNPFGSGDFGDLGPEQVYSY